jgi:hypothetical protein
MIAKYSGSCEYCNGAIPAGEDCYYNITTKKLSHYECSPKTTEPRRRETPTQLADRLGFLVHDRALKTDWARYWLDQGRALPVLLDADRGPASPTAGGGAGRNQRETHPRQDTLWPVREGNGREEWEA